MGTTTTTTPTTTTTTTTTTYLLSLSGNVRLEGLGPQAITDTESTLRPDLPTSLQYGDTQKFVSSFPGVVTRSSPSSPPRSTIHTRQSTYIQYTLHKPSPSVNSGLVLNIFVF